MNKLVRNNIAKMKAYSSAREESSIEADVFLDANENPFPTKVNRYPDPMQIELKRRISEIKGVSMDQLFLGNGSDEVIDLILRIYAEPAKDRIIICPPTYGMYEVLANLNNIGIDEIPLSKDFNIDEDGIIKQYTSQTKLLILCSPNNPSGNVIPLQQLERILQNFPAMVLVDEAYIDFSEQDSAIRILGKYPNLIISQTLSKAYGMAGIRIGIAIASREIVNILNKVKPPYNINSLSQQYAIKHLNNVSDHRVNIDEIIVQRAWLEKQLKQLNMTVKVYPSEANFLLVEFKNSGMIYEELLRLGIVVRNRSKQINCENCLRITVGMPTENQQLIKNLIKLDV